MTCVALLVALAAPAVASAQQAPVTPTTRAPSVFHRPFFVEVETGASYMALLSVRGSHSVFPNMVTYSGWGPGVGLTAGFHALIFSVALQLYASFMSGDGTVLNPSAGSGVSTNGNFNMVATTVEGAFRLPMGRVELTMRLGVGHLFMGGFTSGANTTSSSVTADGWTMRAGLGLDVRIYDRWFAGLDADVAVANVRRSGIAGTDCPGTDPLCAELQQDGDAVALMFHPHLQFGVHF